MSDPSIQAVLLQMRQVARQLDLPQTQAPDAAGQASFREVLGDALGQVSSVQAKAADLAKRYELEDDRVSLPQVMVAMEQASVSFEALKQVRNRLVAAYQEIMNMPI